MMIDFRWSRKTNRHGLILFGAVVLIVLTVLLIRKESDATRLVAMTMRREQATSRLLPQQQAAAVATGPSSSEIGERKDHESDKEETSPNGGNDGDRQVENGSDNAQHHHDNHDANDNDVDNDHDHNENSEDDNQNGNEEKNEEEVIADNDKDEENNDDDDGGKKEDSGEDGESVENETDDETEQNWEEEERVNGDVKNHQQGKTSEFSCAPWIPRERRKVVFVDVDRWDDFYGKNPERQSRGAGEDYWSACLDYAIRQNGFEVEFRGGDGGITEEDVATIHRIILGWTTAERGFFHLPNALCRTRALNYFGNWHGTDQDSGFDTFDPRQILTAFPESYNTFMGFFPHSLLDSGEAASADGEDGGGSVSSPQAERTEKHGLVLCKIACTLADFELSSHILERLMKEEGFTMHVTVCGPNDGADEDNECCDRLLPTGEGFVRHGRLSPDKYHALLKKMSFLLGLDVTPIPPSPLEALANGVAFLNPLTDQGANNEILRTFPLQPPVYRPIGLQPESNDRVTQHDALAMVGFPYVYNVDLQEPDTVLWAARMSFKHRFAHFVPWEFRPATMVERVCQLLLEDESLCDCPNPIWDRKNQFYPKADNLDEDDAKVECMASSYIRS